MSKDNTKLSAADINDRSAESPQISVIMSVHNSESTLIEALDSIFNQTYTNWEIVVCDDASTDGTLNQLRQVSEKLDDGRMTILVNETNRKLAYSLNRCLEVASGEYIARMDGDDISEPSRFEKQLEFLEENPRVDLVGTSTRRFNSKGPGELVNPAASEPDKWTLGQGSRVPFIHATILARRRVFKELGNYTVSWRTERGQDLDLWFKFFAANLVGRNLPEALYWVREDEAAVRRRTPKARFGAAVTRIKGNKSLEYPIRSYRMPAIELLKIFVPYSVYNLNRRWSRRRFLRSK